MFCIGDGLMKKGKENIKPNRIIKNIASLLYGLLTIKIYRFSRRKNYKSDVAVKLGMI